MTKTKGFLVILLMCTASTFAQNPGYMAVNVGSGATPNLTPVAGFTHFNWILSTNVTSSSWSSTAPGSGSLNLCENGTGGYTVVFPTNFVGFQPMASTAAGYCQEYTWFYDGSYVTAIGQSMQGNQIVTQNSLAAGGLAVAGTSGAFSGNEATGGNHTVGGTQTVNGQAALCATCSGNTQLGMNDGTNPQTVAMTPGGLTSTTGFSGNLSVSIPNCGTGGTVLNQPAKQIGSGSSACVTSTVQGDGTNVIGIVTSGAGTTGSATVTMVGQASCVFDNSTTVNDWVQVSSAGTSGTVEPCHDAGSTLPANGGDLLGRVQGTGAAGTYSVFLFPVNRSLPQQLATSSQPVFVAASMAGGSAPTCAVASGAGTGATCSLSANSTDMGGVLTLNTGTGTIGTSGALLVTISFGQTHTNAPSAAQIQVASAPLGTTTVPVVTVGCQPSTSQWCLDANQVALSASTAYKFSYILGQ